MDESTRRRSDAIRRRVYVIALAGVAPFLPLIGWVRAAREPLAVPVYAALTVGTVATLIGLLTRKLSVRRAESLVVTGLTGIVFLRLTGAAYLTGTEVPDLRVLVVETIGPTLIACVLIVYLAFELRPARRWSLVLWGAFTALLLPRVVAGWAEHSDAGVAMLRQSLILAAVVGLAYGLASLKTQLAEERVRARDLDELANTDPLTGLSNRRGVELALRQQLAQAERYGSQLSIALFDLDRFKERNDHHGHAAGDAALVAVASTLRAELRAADVIGRWGGDELLIIVPGAPPADARRSAERWRRLIAELGLAAGDGQVTTSIGLATHQPDDTVDTLLTRADRALYAAKRAGGNAVVTDEGQGLPDIVPAHDRTSPS